MINLELAIFFSPCISNKAYYEIYEAAHRALGLPQKFYSLQDILEVDHMDMHFSYVLKKVVVPNL